MENTEIASRVLNNLGICSQDIWKPRRGNSKELLAQEIIAAIISAHSVPDAAKRLGIGVQTLNRILAKFLVPLLGKATGGNNTWKLKLYYIAKLKKCQSCKTYLHHDNFSAYVDAFDKLDTICRSCKQLKNSAYYENNKDIYHKKYIAEHRKEYAARNAERRARKILATPAWADLSKIKEIYKSCPTGYHVDHIIPLSSDLVCGLHVDNNLRIISAQENLQKSNKLLGDW